MHIPMQTVHLGEAMEADDEVVVTKFEVCLVQCVRHYTVLSCIREQMYSQAH